MLYKSQLEMSNVVSSLPTILLLAFLVWSFRRTMSMTQGGVGGKQGKGGKRGGIGEHKSFMSLSFGPSK